jgi:methionyl-tRNA formyltransferase
MADNFRIIFMGTPDFAVASLSALLNDGNDVVGVVTAPDRPAGRGQQLRASAVKNFAVEHELNVLQPTNLKAPEFAAALQALNADLFVVVAFRMLPEVVWGIPAKGTINLHGSLLPQYRGAAPINRAIINGEKQTGVTTFFIGAAIDTGEIIDQATLAIGPDENAGEVHDRMMITGATLLAKTVRAIAADSAEATPQESMIKPNAVLHDAHKIFKEDCHINWSNDAQQVYNHIRGLIPYPAPWTELIDPTGEKRAVKIYEAKLSAEPTNAAPGVIDTDAKSFLKIAAAGGSIEVDELQVAGKKRMPIKAFLNGFPIDSSWRFE